MKSPKNHSIAAVNETTSQLSEIEELILEVCFVPKRGSSLPNAKSLRDHLRRLEISLEIEESDKCLIHLLENRETAVDCHLILGPKELWAELPLPRSTVFALEYLPWLVSVAREFQLDCKVAHAGMEESETFEPTVENLMRHWQYYCWQEREYQENQGVFFYTAASQLLEQSWEYSLLRPELTRRYGRSKIAAPPVQYWGDRETRRAVTVATWERLEPSVFPLVDYIVLKNPPAPLKSGTIYSLTEVSESLGNLFKSLAMPIQHHLFEKSHHLEEVVANLAPLNTHRPQRFNKIDFADCLDEHPPLSDYRE